MFEQQLGRSVTIDHAAELLHVSRRTIYNRIRDGKLLTIRTLGGSQRVLLSSVEENRNHWSMRLETERTAHIGLPQPELMGVRSSK